MPIKDRDDRESIAPPASVKAQIARPLSAVPMPGDDDYTGQYRSMPEGSRDRSKLRELRRSRTPSERMDRLEDKHDDLVETFGQEIGEIKADVGEIKGKLSVLPKLVDLLESTVDSAAAREQAALDAQVARAEAQTAVDTATKKAVIQKETAIAIAEEKAEINDKLDKRKARRKLWLKIVGGALGAIAVICAHKLVQLWFGWL
jgi:hypothetical protein